MPCSVIAEQTASRIPRPRVLNLVDLMKCSFLAAARMSIRRPATATLIVLAHRPAVAGTRFSPKQAIWPVLGKRLISAMSGGETEDLSLATIRRKATISRGLRARASGLRLPPECGHSH